MGNRLESVKVHWKCYYLISRCPRHRERTLFVPKKVYKFDHAKICLCIYSASCTSNLNKTCRFLCFTRKATSQGVIKKCFWTGVGKINNHYKSDYDLMVTKKLNWRFEGHCGTYFYYIQMSFLFSLKGIPYLLQDSH